MTYLIRAVLVLLASAVAWGADPVVGTWVLNTSKSVFRPGPAPRSQTRVYREGPDGITATVVTVTPDGRSATVEYPVNYDGQARPVAGSPEIDAIRVKKITVFRSESSLLHAGRVIAKATREVSGDEKTLTITYEGSAADGGVIRNTSVYERR